MTSRERAWRVYNMPARGSTSFKHRERAFARAMALADERGEVVSVVGPCEGADDGFFEVQPRRADGSRFIESINV